MLNFFDSWLLCFTWSPNCYVLQGPGWYRQWPTVKLNLISYCFTSHLYFLWDLSNFKTVPHLNFSASHLKYYLLRKFFPSNLFSLTCPWLLASMSYIFLSICFVFVTCLLFMYSLECKILEGKLIHKCIPSGIEPTVASQIFCEKINACFLRTWTLNCFSCKNSAYYPLSLKLNSFVF